MPSSEGNSARRSPKHLRRFQKGSSDIRRQILPTSFESPGRRSPKRETIFGEAASAGTGTMRTTRRRWSSPIARWALQPTSWRNAYVPPKNRRESRRDNAGSPLPKRRAADCAHPAGDAGGTQPPFEAPARGTPPAKPAVPGPHSRHPARSTPPAKPAVPGPFEAPSPKHPAGESRRSVIIRRSHIWSRLHLNASSNAAAPRF